MRKISIIISLVVLLFSYKGMQAQGCMGAGDETIKVIGFVQPQYNFEFQGEDAQGESIDNNNSFLFNRARLGVTGNIPYDISYYAIAEFSPTLGGPYMLDVFVTYTGLGSWASFTLGQFKPPFGLELLTPCHQLYTVDRSRVVNELASPFRDMGLMLFGGSGDRPLFGHETQDAIKYYFAVMNGVGINKLDDNAAKDYIARLEIQPVKFLRLGGSFKYGKQKPAQADLDEDQRTRYGADLQLMFGEFLLQSEYIYGYDQGSTLEGGGCGQDPTLILGDFKKNGFYAQAMYMTPWRIQPVLKYEYYDPDYEADKDNNISTFTVGLNYFLNDWTRVQINYRMNDNENPTKYYGSQVYVQVQAVIP